ncbi:MAG: twitch domain-containing radical SAM protein [Bdellovibrionaceae bacterium]|nr:twitch domain-containing radical SAM protein [Bdellovibrio sp.]
MKNEYDNYRNLTDAAEKAMESKTFCLAKWYHANIYFQTGETHSCYHPAPHKIDIEAIKSNPSAIHNTAFKKEERRQMLTNERPSGCQYCWNIEDLNKTLISDRQIRTGSLYKPERIDEIKSKPKDFNSALDYVELSFSNLCQFKCGYCHPKASSTYLNEIKKFGPYDQVKNHRCDIDYFEVYQEEHNPFIEAWWKWWPELSKTLKILRITGGEPLLQKSTYKMLDYLNLHPAETLELNVNSNLGARSEIILKFTECINNLILNKKIKSFKLFTSVDTWGPQAEYIRTGLNLKSFEENLFLFLDRTQQPLTIMITFNIFSVVNFSLLLKKILEWRSIYSENLYSEHKHRIRFDISYLKEPLQYDINLLPKDEFMRYMDDHLLFIKKNLDDSRTDRFSFMEYQRFLRIYEYMQTTVYSDDKLNEGRKDFYNFFSELDRRRDCNLVKTFPEMKDFFNMCKETALNS